MSVTEILRWFYAHFEYPWALVAILPLIILTIWLLRRELGVKDDPEVRRQKLKARRLMLFTRSVMIATLLFALASPYIQQEKIIEGDPFIEMIVDNSTSMSLFENTAPELAKALEKKLNTEVKVAGTGIVSNIGDSVLASIQPHSSVLLFSDGNVNSGADLGDVALFASKMNASINAIMLKPIRNDIGVEIFGPEKILEDAEATFSVVVNRVGTAANVQLKVMLDDEVVVDEATDKNVFVFTKVMTKGTHRLTATVQSTDYFPTNNVFYKTVKVVPQPAVLFLSEKSSPLKTLLEQLYVVDTATSLPSDMSKYYAVVVNDLPASKVNGFTDVLNDFVADGNGMLVVGGENSFDKGDYKRSVFESLLPVQVGSPEKKDGDVVVAIVIDISGSQGTPFGRFASTSDFSKAATLEIMNSMKGDTRVAIIAFNTQAYLVSEPTPVFAKKGVEDLIQRIKWGGGTNIGAGLLKALSVLGEYGGSQNIVLLSDGKTQASAAAYEAARYAANSGVKIYTVGVGPSTDEQTMMDLADLTNGIYFRATEESRLRIIFGDTDDQEAQSGQMAMVVLNKNHFITDGYEQSPALYGFNQVSPKSAGRLLATTSTGDPVLTVWRLGLGRVAALTVDDGGKWASSLLEKGNSRIMSRTMNWAIGDPERKSSAFVDAKDTRLNEPTEITVKSSVPPTAENVVFYKIDEDVYSGSLLADSVGFQSAAGAVFAVSYEQEYGRLGMNPELEKIVGSTGGRIFDASEIDKIVQHAKTRARRVVNAREYIRAPFVVLAIIVFLLEIFIRRLVRRE